jgi:hypothetical protein
MPDVAGAIANVPAKIANTSMSAVLQDLVSTPLGSAPGDPTPELAYNRAPSEDLIRYFVRNWSGNKNRRYIKEYVSLFGGGEQTAKEKKEKGEPFSIEELRAKISRGQDASIVADGTKAIPAILTGNSQKFLVEPTKNPKEDPPWVPITGTVYDLYYGNFERLHGGDPREAAREMESLALRRRVDPVMRVDKHGRPTNPFGFLEFKREVMEPKTMAVDAEEVFAGEYIEV